jgi:hypothetical protein
VDVAELRERVRERLPLGEIMGRDVTVKRSGTNRWVCCCPFHQEKSPSFTIGGRFPDRGHCFGCGEDVDIFAYWMKTRGVEFLPALIELADMAGVIVPAELRDPNYRPAKRPQVRTPERPRVESEDVKPDLPPFWQLRKEHVEEIAQVRGLDVAAIRHAAFVEKRVAYSMWPLYESRGEWLPRSNQEVVPSWVVTDHTRNVAEFRRMDGGKYARADGSFIKAWSTRGKNWPVGCLQMGDKCAVMLVEGGPDMLAGFHFLRRFRMLDRVAVVCMLGASNSMREAARPLFKGKRVRIFVDADEPKDDENPRKRKMPGQQACDRWTHELTEAGAAVASFCVGPVYDDDRVGRWGRGEISSSEITVLQPGLVKKDGSAVKDLNDLAFAEEAVIESASVRRAFLDWDF